MYTLKDELPRSVGAQYATGDQWRNNSRKNEETEPKQKQHPIVDVTGDGSKEQYCIGTWNVRFLCNIALYSIRLYLHHQSHPQLGVVFILAPSLHSFWNYFSNNLQ